MASENDNLNAAIGKAAIASAADFSLRGLSTTVWACARLGLDDALQSMCVVTPNGSLLCLTILVLSVPRHFPVSIFSWFCVYDRLAGPVYNRRYFASEVGRMKWGHRLVTRLALTIK